MGKRGAPKGNQNARKYGFYSKALADAARLNLQDAAHIEGVDEELAVLRLQLRDLVQNHPDSIDLQIRLANAIARMVRTRYQLDKNEKRPLRDAIANVLREVAAPLGVGVGMGVGMKAITK
jgi:hypothetical protein